MEADAVVSRSICAVQSLGGLMSKVPIGLELRSFGIIKCWHAVICHL